MNVFRNALLSLAVAGMIALAGAAQAQVVDDYFVVGATTVDDRDTIVDAMGWMSMDHPNNLFSEGCLRIHPAEQGPEGISYFIKDLGDSYNLVGFTYAFWPGQGWSGLTVEVTNDADWATANWTQVCVYPATEKMIDSDTFWFDSLAAARYIRVTTTETNILQMNSMTLYGTDIPEPATMSLLALGGLAMLRRRK
ncbi:MAG: PEP-CTERM sorting domain-containing protein [Phycisphaerae bacterium]|nr:PEP-CTERM sorting domain-containing protein [Phycisphaerae bacterium]